MSHFQLKDFLTVIPKLKYSQDANSCWNGLEQGIRELTKQKDDGESLPFQQWWKSCFYLMAAHQVQISYVNYKPSKQGEQEFIEVLNNGPAIIDLSKWRLNASNKGQDFIFPNGTSIEPNNSVRVYTSTIGLSPAGSDQVLSFNSPTNLLNNQGDVVHLYDSEGNEISSWVYGNKAHEDLVINQISYDSTQHKTEGDEYVEITNLGQHWVDLSHWQLSAGKNQNFHFPENCKVRPFTYIRVYTNQVHQASGGFSFNSPTALWNNEGGRGVLSDAEGKEVSTYYY